MFMGYFNQSTVSKNKSMSKLLISVLLACLLVAFTGLSLYGCKSASSNEISLRDEMVSCSFELVSNATMSIADGVKQNS